MPNITTTYSAAAATVIPMNLSGLAASPTFIAGRECTQIDNTVTKYIDAIVYGWFIVGTTPTIPANFSIYAWGNDVSLAITPIDTLVGVNNNRTLTNTTVLNSALGIVRSPPILVATSDLKYVVLPFSMRDVLRSPLPPFWGLFCSHNMTAALKIDAGNTDAFRFHGITYTST